MHPLAHRWDIKSFHSFNGKQFVCDENFIRYSYLSRKNVKTKRWTHNAFDERRGENDNFRRWPSYDRLQRHCNCRLETIDDWLLIKLSIYIFSEIHFNSMFAFNGEGSVFSGIPTESKPLLSLELRTHVFRQSIAGPWIIALIFGLELFILMDFPQFSG